MFSGTDTYKVINPLRESVKLSCIGGWVSLCGPIEAGFPRRLVENQSPPSFHIISAFGPHITLTVGILAFSLLLVGLSFPNWHSCILAAVRTTVSTSYWEVLSPKSFHLALRCEGKCLLLPFPGWRRGSHSSPAPDRSSCIWEGHFLFSTKK